MADRKVFTVGEPYRSKGQKYEEDKFARWINKPLDKGVGIGNSRGIRKIDNEQEDEKIEFLVFYSKNISKSSSENPWDDITNLEDGRIKYWGDAKPKHDKVDEPDGNSWIKDIYSSYYAKENREQAPPVLYFENSENEDGENCVRFKGLCIIDELHIERYRYEGDIVVNYLVELAVLDTDEVSLEWIHEKAKKSTNEKAPDVWKEWVKTGKVKRYNIWNNRIRESDRQIPTGDYWQLLKNIREVTDGGSNEKGEKLEYLVELALKELNFDKVRRTPSSGDKGVDIKGKIDILEEFELKETDTKIDFKAQVKNKKVNPRNEKRAGGISGKDLSRLASRIDDGEIGLFFTTSYFPTKAQEENLSTYPIKLISGKELSILLSQTSLTKDFRIRDDIIDKIENEFEDTTG